MSTFQVSRAVARSLGDVIAGRPQVYSDPDTDIFPNTGSSLFGRRFDRLMSIMRPPGDRLKELQYYDYLENEIADVPRALDAFATMACTGNLAGGGTTTFTIKPADTTKTYPAELLERFKRLEKLIAINAYVTLRTMTKYGSYMPQILIGRDESGKLFVEKIKPIPPGTIYRRLDKDGKSDPDRYWEQRVDGASPVTDTGGETKAIPQWILPHFAIWANVVDATTSMLYGTSILKPFGAIGLKVHAMLDASVVARLSRAAMRYRWDIDVSDLYGRHNIDIEKAINSRLSRFKNSLSRSTDLLGTGGQDGFQRASIPDEDFFVPAGKDLAFNVDTLAGDANLPRVQDIELAIRFYFGALGLPPEYLGHERSQGGRSVLSQLDIQFARGVRHIQMYGAAGFQHIVMVDMILGGFDPKQYPVECVPPQIGARDDLLQAQIRALQSQVIANLVTAGMDPTVSAKWVLETFMDLDEDLKTLTEAELKVLFKAIEAVDAGAGASGGGTVTGGKRKVAKEDLRHVVSANTRNMMAMIRDNVRMLAVDMEDLRGVYSNGQPTATQLAEQIAGHIDPRDLT